MRQFVFFILVFSCLKSFSQETNKVAPIVNDSFIVIISVLDNNSTQTITDIQSYLKQSGSGLRYMGFCTNQNCFILNASGKKYGVALDVLKNLETQLPNASIDYKKVAIADFYKSCTFSNPEEYHYFKLNYH
ncbi:MAG: hypothetical protein ABI388_10490 [Bacteroidia bacterium]